MRIKKTKLEIEDDVADDWEAEVADQDVADNWEDDADKLFDEAVERGDIPEDQAERLRK